MDNKKKYAIAVIHDDGVVGYLTSSKNSNVETYRSKRAAMSALEDKMKDNRYSWSLPMEVREYEGET